MSRANLGARTDHDDVAPRPADAGSDDDVAQVGRFARLRAAWQRLFGYDFFLSYAWADGRPYAETLVRELTSEPHRYRCFIDRHEMGGGAAWRSSVRKALRRSSVMVLVASPQALQSNNVFEEVRTFAPRGRPLVPISFARTIEALPTSHRLYGLLEERLRAPEEDSLDRLARGEPSRHVVEYLHSSFGFVRVDRLRTAILTGIAITLLVLAGLAGSSSLAERAARALAEDQRRQAQSRELAARAQLQLRDGDPTSALSSAIEAGERAETVEVDAALRDAIRSSNVKAILSHTSGVVYHAAYSPSGDKIVTVGDKAARVWDAKSYMPLRDLPHDSPVYYTVFSPDGRKIATGERGRIRIWDAASWSPIHSFKVEEGVVRHIAFDREGKRIISASSATVRVWDVETGKSLHQFPGHQGEVRHAAFSPGGSKIIASTPEARQAIIRDLETGKYKALPTRSPVVRAEFSPDGKTIVTAGGPDGGTLVWEDPRGWTDLRAIEPVSKTLEQPRGGVHHLAFSKAGDRLATAGGDGSSRIWKKTFNQWSEVAPLPGHKGPVNYVGFSSDDQRILTGGDDGIVRIWARRADIIKETWHELATLVGHKGAIWRAAFSPDGRQILTTSKDGTAQVWNRTNQDIAILREHDGKVKHVMFSTDGKLVLTTAERDFARLWNAQTGNLLKQLRPTYSDLHAAFLNSETDKSDYAAFSPDGTKAVTVHYNNIARVWAIGSETSPVLLSGHEGPVRYAIFSPDGRRILTTSNDKTARIWDANSGHLVTVLEGHEKDLWSGSFSSSGDRVLTTSWDGTARIWNIGDARQPMVVADESDISRASFSYDGRRIVTISRGIAKIWDVAGTAAKVLRKLHVENAQVLHAEFCHRDKDNTLAAGLNDGTVRVWDIGKDAEPIILRGHKENEKVHHVTFSPDCSKLVTASADHTARIWDTKKGVALAHLLGHSEPVTYAAFSHDGKQVATASEDRTVRLHFTGVTDLLPLATSLLPLRAGAN